MGLLARILSRPTAKPYRSADVQFTDEPPCLDEDGFVAFGPGDIENPKNWSTTRRSYVTFVAVLLVTNATFASSSPSACLEGISSTFDVSVEAAGLTVTLFLLGYCFGPLGFAPLSEFYGRRYIFYISFFGYIAFNFLCAFAPNFGSLLVGRFLAGTFISAPLSNGPGVLADLFGPIGRTNGMALFAAMVWAGPALGPVISGFLQLKEDWRWSFYVLLWLAGVSAVFMFTLPETYAPLILAHKARRVRKARVPGYEDVRAPLEASDRSLLDVYKVALTRPWIILFDPISFLVAIYLSVVYLLLYMLFTIYPLVFISRRGWNSGVGELPLLGTTVGAALGAGIIMLDSQRQLKKMATGWKMRPEDRLPIAMFGGIALFVSMFWLSWSAEYNSVHWIVPTLAGTFLSTAMMLIFVAYLSYLVDTYLMYAASAIAANTVVRSAAGASAPLFTRQMFEALGIGGGGSLIGGVAALLAIIPFAFYKYGEQIRVRSRFAPTQPRPSTIGDEERQDHEQQPRQQQEEEPKELQKQHDGGDKSPTSDENEKEVRMTGSDYRPTGDGEDGGLVGGLDVEVAGPPRKIDDRDAEKQMGNENSSSLTSEDERWKSRQRDRDTGENALGEPQDKDIYFGEERG